MCTANCRDTDSLDFLVATPRSATCTEAPKVQPQTPEPPAHDPCTRLLRRLQPDPETLGRDARPMVHTKGGALVLDDSTRDKPAEKIALVTRHWSGKHKAVVWGSNLIMRVCRALHATARRRGFESLCVAFDRGDSILDNLKAVRALGWTFLMRLKFNRTVDVGRAGTSPVDEAAVGEAGTAAHLPGFDALLIFTRVSRDGDVESGGTNDLALDELTRPARGDRCWAIEADRRALKQCWGVERAEVGSGVAQRNHIGLAIRAFLRLESHFFTTGVSW